MSGVHRPLASQETRDYKSIKQRSAESEESNATDPADKEPKKRKQCCYRQKRSLYEHVVYFCSLGVASYIGVFTRIYLSKLAKWNGVPLFASLYPQLLGTAIMGFITSHRLLLNGTFIYPAIATGLCGSITTFSSWNFEAASSLLQSGDHLGARVLSWATTLILGLGVMSSALSFGRHLAALSPWADSRLQNREAKPSFTSNHCHIIEGNFFICAWLLLTALVTTLPLLLRRRDLMFSGLLAILGTYLRWHLSPFNSSFQHFKLGTFLANVTGAWLLGGIVHAKVVYADREWVHSTLVGVALGFCGCVTTVSTFAAELSDLPLCASYVYATISIAMAQLGIILIKETLQWTSNWKVERYWGSMYA